MTGMNPFASKPGTIRDPEPPQIGKWRSIGSGAQVDEDEPTGFVNPVGGLRQANVTGQARTGRGGHITTVHAETPAVVYTLDEALSNPPVEQRCSPVHAMLVEHPYPAGAVPERDEVLAE